MVEILGRLVREGDFLTYTGRWGQGKAGRVKNLTVGKPYQVVEARVRFPWVSGVPDKNKPGKVESVRVANDKGLIHDYSIKNFELPDGIVSDETLIYRQVAVNFQEELRSL